MRKTVFVLQPDPDRQSREIARRQSPPRGFGADPQHVLFVDVEIHVNGVELHDGRELGRRRRTDEFSDRNKMRADDAIERRDDIGIAEIDCGDPGVGLGLLQAGLGVIAGRSGRIEGRLRNRLPGNQIHLTVVVGLGLLQCRPRPGLGRLCLLELVLVGFGLDREQRRALLHETAVLVVDRLQHALHPRHEIDGLKSARCCRWHRESA